MRFLYLLALPLCAAAAISVPDLDKARDRQDRASLQRMASEVGAAAAKQPQSSAAQYQFALAQSYVAEVATELKDKDGARAAAETGIAAAEKAVALEGNKSEHHRILGTLCGQAIPGNLLAALKYGKCALDEMNKAVELDPKSAKAYLGRGVGNYYLPAQFGGGPEKSVQDLEKAIQLEPRNAEAYLWLGISLRKLNRNPEAHKALEKAVQLNPGRVWAKQQLEKTPVK